MKKTNYKKKRNANQKWKKIRTFHYSFIQNLLVVLCTRCRSNKTKGVRMHSTSLETSKVVFFFFCHAAHNLQNGRNAEYATQYKFVALFDELFHEYICVAEQLHISSVCLNWWSKRTEERNSFVSVNRLNFIVYIFMCT